MAIVVNKGNAYEPVDHHWHADAAEVHGSGGDGVPDESVSLEDVFLVPSTFYSPTGDVLSIAAAASNVNGVTIFGHSAGSAPFIAATGTDTNIHLQLFGKGTGCPMVPGLIFDSTISVPVRAGPVTAGFLPSPAATWTALTNAGALSLRRGNWTGTGNGANIWRFEDRVFVGEAASKLAGDSTSVDAGTSWINLTEHARYLGLNSHVVVSSQEGCLPYGITVAMRNSDTNTEAIAFAAAMISDGHNSTWGGILEMVRAHDSYHSLGWEINQKNNANNNTLTPNGQVPGAYGLWLVGGGDAAFGGVALNPSTAALVILKNSHTWNDGIVFMSDSLTAGKAITLSSVAAGGGHALNWYNASGAQVFKIVSSSAGARLWQFGCDDGGPFFYTSTGPAILVQAATNNVNGITIYSNSAGAAPLIVSQGSDTNIDLILGGKGTGGIVLNTGSKLNASTAGLNTKQAVNNVHDTAPTNAELTTSFGTPASLGRGFIGTVDDADGNLINYICWTSDASWYYLKGTKAA